MNRYKYTKLKNLGPVHGFFINTPDGRTIKDIYPQVIVRELNRLNDRINRLEDCAETAWGIIANVDSGSWQEQRADWREAATRWRDERFHPELSEFKTKEDKP